MDGLVPNWRSALMGLIALCTIAPALLLSIKDAERRAALVLLAFLCAASASAVPMIIGFAGAYDRWPGLTFLPTDFTLLLGPLFALHAHALMARRIPPWIYGLMAPGAAYGAYQVWAFVALGDYEAKWAYTRAVHDPIIAPVVVALASALAVWALVETHRLRRRYRRWLADRRSDAHEFAPVWSTRLLVFGVPVAAVWIGGAVVAGVSGFSYADRFWIDFAAQLLLFLIAIDALSSLHRPFPKMPAAQEAALEAAAAPAPEKDWTGAGERMRRTVRSEGWYREAGFSLAELARRMNSNQTTVSRAINAGLGVRFNDLVNALRVEEAKRRLEDTDASLIDIALMSGFGSKASFNRVFKAHCGETPSAYRARCGGASVLAEEAG